MDTVQSIPIPQAIHWQSCPQDPLAWIAWRELLLKLLLSPALLLPLVSVLGFALAWRLRLPPWTSLASAMLCPLLISCLYSPAATHALSGWLQAQLPKQQASSTPTAVVVLVGRGPAIAAATTQAAAHHVLSGQAAAVYVSGDQRSTAEQLVSLGVPANRVAGDSCARTTWENATLTSAWLQQHHPGAPVLLITDPWQLPRASRAFSRQGLSITALAAEPPLAAAARNRLALREAAGTLLYGLQGRM
jgi:uncharacterized SAM-binding protein YcdF (DUF218 family)